MNLLKSTRFSPGALILGLISRGADRQLRERISWSIRAKSLRRETVKSIGAIHHEPEEDVGAVAVKFVSATLLSIVAVPS